MAESAAGYSSNYGAYASQSSQEHLGGAYERDVDDIWTSEDIHPIEESVLEEKLEPALAPPPQIREYSPYRDEAHDSSLGSFASPTPIHTATLLWDPAVKEADDILHNEDFNDKRDLDIFTLRGFVNIITLVLLALGLLMLFIGYPILSAVNVQKQRKS
ncbi:beta-glucan synthesis-associated protein [Schizosaccharomyces japonicus yFS275]|uniref:Beta-glucan synthesis-associated protein n=1 Tax=Schizosaccharomyces japonicus (strain yFS275 / FY16936) TaxID=402676 RepID=B6K7H8_SCHJY|nr:beta-glucan synthesis-associated protein [Schizosaccharomyces japonicus yFS275]EEB09482.1 beta-glucan synthesis-associated protein [Schizosaccharomyces japonicus yFS275]